MGNLDNIIQKLLTADHDSLHSETDFCLSSEEISELNNLTIEHLKNQDTVLQYKTAGRQIKVVGDIHGQYDDLLKIFEDHNSGTPSETSYLFLGDYVDRGKKSLYVISLLFAYVLKYPQTFFLIRGNHEMPSVNIYYGFFAECMRRNLREAFLQFNNTFNYLPLAAVIDEKIFCCHGGLSPDLKTIAQLNDIKRPIKDMVEESVEYQLVWNDPFMDDDRNGCAGNLRGPGIKFFGKDVLESFLDNNGLTTVVRANETVMQGYKCRADKKLYTVFSAPNYCNRSGNDAAVMTIQDGKVGEFDMYNYVQVR